MLNAKEASSVTGGGASSPRKKKSLTVGILNKVHNFLFKYRLDRCCSYDPDSHQRSSEKKINGGSDSFTPKNCLKKRNAETDDGKSKTSSLSFSRSFTGKRDTGDCNSPNGLSRGTSRRIMFSESNGTVRAPSMEKNLECMLEELCFGCNKKIKVDRDVVHTKSGQLAQEEETLMVKVKPGWRQGTKITFKGEEREPSGTFTADITLEITEEQHPLFHRNGKDLEMKVEIPLVNALTGCIVPVTLLGGDIIHPGYEKNISGQGMSVSNEEQQSRGDLRVLFVVKFPSQLSDEQRKDVFRFCRNVVDLSACMNI